MTKLDEILPEELKQDALPSGNELILNYLSALAAIRIAAENQIAVLGLELFEMRPDGIVTVSYTGYDKEIKRGEGDWGAYAKAMNLEAEKWLHSNKLEGNHGYILMSATEIELAAANKLFEKRSLISRFFGLFH